MTEVNLGGIVDNSTVDYIGKVCAVIYLCGCPYRCPWCQNRELIEGGGNCKMTSLDDIIAKLGENFLIDAVCLTGGEPLMQEETIGLLKKIKTETTLSVKLDTNGFYPERLERALPYIDFIAIDIKAPFDERYGKATGRADAEEVVGKVSKSMDILKNWDRKDGRMEARTTIVPGLMEEADIEAMTQKINDTGFAYYTLQQFRPMNTLDPGYEKLESPRPEYMLKLATEAKKHLPEARVRTVTQQDGFRKV